MTKNSSSRAFLLVSAAAVLGIGAPAQSGGKPQVIRGTATTSVSVYATGFNNPRGLKFGPDGMLYVAEADRAEAIQPLICAIRFRARVPTPAARQVVASLGSTAMACGPPLPTGSRPARPVQILAIWLAESRTSPSSAALSTP